MQEDPEYILKFQSNDVKRVMGSLNTSAATAAFESGGGGAKAQACLPSTLHLPVPLDQRSFMCGWPVFAAEGATRR